MQQVATIWGTLHYPLQRVGITLDNSKQMLLNEHHQTVTKAKETPQKMTLM